MHSLFSGRTAWPKGGIGFPATIVISGNYSSIIFLVHILLLCDYSTLGILQSPFPCCVLLCSWRLELLKVLQRIFQKWRHKVYTFCCNIGHLNTNYQLSSVAKRLFGSICKEDTICVPSSHREFFNQLQLCAFTVVARHKRGRGRFSLTSTPLLTPSLIWRFLLPLLWIICAVASEVSYSPLHEEKCPIRWCIAKNPAEEALPSCMKKPDIHLKDEGVSVNLLSRFF